MRGSTSGARPISRAVLTFSLCVSAVLWTGCSSSKSNPADAVPTDTARDSAVDNVEAGTTDAIEAMTQLLIDSEATTLALGAVAGIDLEALTGAEGGDIDPFIAQISAVVTRLLNALLQNPSRSGATITYTPDATAFCSDEALEDYLPTPDDVALCETLLGHVTIVQTIEDEDEGLLALRFDGTQPLVVRYGPSSGHVEVDLTQLAAALVRLQQIVDPDAGPIDLPDEIRGVVRLGFEDLGDRAARVVLSIPQTIRIVGTMGGESVAIDVAATNTVIGFTADGVAGTGIVTLALQAVSAAFPVEDDASTIYAGVLTLAGLTGTISFTNATQTVTVTDLGIGGVPLRMLADGEEVFSLSIADIDMTVDGSAQTMTMGSALDIVFSAANVFGLVPDLFEGSTNPNDPSLVGTVTIELPADSVLTVTPVTDSDDILQLTSGGPLTVDGTGEFAGSTSISEGSCFQESDSNLLFEVVPCP